MQHSSSARLLALSLRRILLPSTAMAKRTAAEAAGITAEGSSPAAAAEAPPLDAFHRDAPDSRLPRASKAILENFPRFLESGALKKYLRKQNIEFSNLRKGKHPVATITFASDELRDAAVATLNTLSMRSAPLKARVLTSEPDPFVVQQGKRAKRQGDDKPVLEGPPAEQIATKVAPYRHLDYDLQLKRKHRSVVNTVKTMCKQMCGPRGGRPTWALEAVRNNALPFDVQFCVPSPVQHGYRSKCEFSIGVGPTGEDKTVGFMLGAYQDGILTVAEPTAVSIVPEHVREIVAALQECIRASPLPAHDRVRHIGVFRELLVRTTVTKETMAMLLVCDTDLSPETLAEEHERIRAFFSAKIAEGLRLDHLLVQVDNSVSCQSNERPPAVPLLGNSEGVITETLLGLKFHVSPAAFFQSNVPCAAVLFDKIREWSGLEESTKDDTVLLDICCGTGTIGQVMANHASDVLGFEMVPEAIEDAKANARLNGIENVKYFVGKAEDTMAPIVSGLAGKAIVGIVDPPRSGLHGKVVRTIRLCPRLERLVYVACSLKSAQQNLIDLCRPKSNTWGGVPFRIVSAVPVDMFPQTDHCEVVLLLLRGKPLREALGSEGDDDKSVGDAATPDGDADMQTSEEKRPLAQAAKEVAATATETSTLPSAECVASNAADQAALSASAGAPDVDMQAAEAVVSPLAQGAEEVQAANKEITPDTSAALTAEETSLPVSGDGPNTEPHQ